MTTLSGSLISSMVITYKTQDKINYPAYVLPYNTWKEEDGIMFLSGKVLDDRNQTGNTLGVRRVQTPLKNLHPIRRMVFDWIGIVKSEHKYFIDSNGMCFTYLKTMFATLKYVPIKEVIKRDKNCILKIAKAQFIIPRHPHHTLKYAGVLYNGDYPWALYRYSEFKLKTGGRKV